MIKSRKFYKNTFSYNTETGVITKNGVPVGSKSSHGYVRMFLGKKRKYNHQVAFWIMTGKHPVRHIDHKNGIRHDNRWENIRLASPAENNRQRRSWGRSGYKGVYMREDGRFRACLVFNENKINLGSYKCPIQAAKAYDAKAIELYGDFKKLNFPIDRK